MITTTVCVDLCSLESSHESWPTAAPTVYSTCWILKAICHTVPAGTDYRVCRWPWQFIALRKADRPLLESRRTLFKTTLGWSAAVFWRCEVTQLSSVVFYVLGAVHRFDFWFVINRTPNNQRPVDIRSCSDRLIFLTMCILYNQQDATYTMFFIIISALHISGGFSAQHQELIKLYVQPWLQKQFYKLLMMGGKTARNMYSADNNKEQCVSCISLVIQGVPGGMCQTSGGCSLC